MIQGPGPVDRSPTPPYVGSFRPPGEGGWGSQLASSHRPPVVCGVGWWRGYAQCGLSGKIGKFVRVPILNWVRSFPYPFS